MVRQRVRQRRQHDERYVLVILFTHAHAAHGRTHVHAHTAHARGRRNGSRVGTRLCASASRRLVAFTAEERAEERAVSEATPPQASLGPEGAGVSPDAARNGGDAPSTLSCVCWQRCQGMAPLPPSVCVSDSRRRCAPAQSVSIVHRQALEICQWRYGRRMRRW